jgi:hypothetical protein
MVTTTERIAELLQLRKERMQEAPSLASWYETQLIQEFPSNVEVDDLFLKNTFTGSDEDDYLRGRRVFEGKNWLEVNFDSLYSTYVQFCPLSPKGNIYYTPAFLKNFYDLKHLELEFFTYFLQGLEEGFRIPGFDELEAWSKDHSNKIRADYSSFESFTPSQSKLIAVFLVNVANLLPPEWHDARSAQRALTNYWGNFLLF